MSKVSQEIEISQLQKKKEKKVSSAPDDTAEMFAIPLAAICDLHLEA